MVYGREIGRKFYKDGSVRTYPGNTVVSDVTPACSAYGVMCQLRKMVQESELADHFILLPEDSYHMTMIRGVNDQVRKPGFWPEQLSLDAPMEQVEIMCPLPLCGLACPAQAK